MTTSNPTTTTSATRADQSTSRLRTMLTIGAAAVLVNGFIHFYLYFRGGYRGITGSETLGLTISRSFALNVIAALVIAELLVLALRYDRLVIPAVLAGIGFSIATLIAYVLVRTVGLLGFTDDQTSTEAVIAVIAELVGIAVLVPVLASLVRKHR